MKTRFKNKPTKTGFKSWLSLKESAGLAEDLESVHYGRSQASVTPVSGELISNLTSTYSRHKVGTHTYTKIKNNNKLKQNKEKHQPSTLFSSQRTLS